MRPTRLARSLGAAALVLTMAALMGQGPPGGGRPGPPPPPQGPPPPPSAPPPPPPAPAPPLPPALGDPLPGLSNSLMTRFSAGKAQFLEVEDVPGGLGPVFTESSCVQCHSAGAVGGAGVRLVTRFARITNGQFDPMVEFGGPQLQDRGIGKFNGVNFVGEVVPKTATIVAQRRTIPLFGLGLVDAVPDNALLAVAQREMANNPSTAGRANFGTDPLTGARRVNRFGWKAQQPTVFAFAGDAYLNELGVTAPRTPDENCPQGQCNLLAANPAASNPNDGDETSVSALADFITYLAPPSRGPVFGDVAAGQALFAQVGCTDCHHPSYQTGPSTTPALNGMVFSPYSDFLLHDMGPLGDGMVQSGAGATEIRTAPLWGLRFEPSYLHDGRAPTVSAAILAHDGQARASRNRFAALNKTQQAQLLAFLNSL